ncbi:MAG: 4-(cytidine 5'-diphospho)-2-C-methyl-D-erythritol kinase [Ferruginibacter sp.]
MVVFPNAKINIGLNILGKRADGFHDLQTIFYPVGCKDILELIPADAKNDIPYTYSSSGRAVDGNEAENLCIKALQLIRKDYPALPSLKIHLHKEIPMGAGLGGGSADAAFMLKLIDQYFELHLTEAQLSVYALQLGSDCPFFLYNKPCLATGRGEQLQPVELDLSAYSILLVNPGIHVNTGWAFRSLELEKNSTDLTAAIKAPIESWKQVITNDFEKPVFKEYPAIADVKNQLYEAGAVYAAMSGSGSTVFGIFPEQSQMQLNFPAAYFTKWV